MCLTLWNATYILTIYIEQTMKRNSITYGLLQKGNGDGNFQRSELEPACPSSHSK